MSCKFVKHESGVENGGRLDFFIWWIGFIKYGAQNEAVVEVDGQIW